MVFEERQIIFNFNIAMNKYKSYYDRTVALNFLQEFINKLNESFIKENFELATNKDKDWYYIKRAISFLQEVVDNQEILNKLDEPLIKKIYDIAMNICEFSDIRIAALKFLQKNPDKLDMVQIKSIYKIAMNDCEFSDIRIAALNVLITLPVSTLNELNKDLNMKIDNILTDGREKKDLAERFGMLKTCLKKIKKLQIQTNTKKQKNNGQANTNPPKTKNTIKI